jgi:trigger factor
MHQVTEDLMERHEINLPDSFFKRWILASQDDGEKTFDQIESEYPNYANAARWQLIQDKITKQYDVAVQYNDVVNYTMGLLASNYQQYGMPVPEPAELQKHAEDYLNRKGKEDETRQISNMLFEARLLELVKKRPK